MTYAQKFTAISLLTLVTVILLTFATVKGFRFVKHRLFGHGKHHKHALVIRGLLVASLGR